MTLLNCERVEFDTALEDDIITIRHYSLMPNVRLEVYDEEDSVLVIGKHAEIQLHWNEETRRLFERVGEVTAEELFRIVVAHSHPGYRVS
ncbi:hypothetical protein [Paenibacillus sp. Y412MC10]|uniref:hypothetical protein n=1 Tax=Geobacillus sp. (strain Y412MC10) TaxID=481743 RepID=UPI0011AA5FC9|nr:hypothetical protein [Paenibacillus sp. Y412MC10]